MGLTVTQMAARVLRDIQIPSDSSTAYTNALADVKQYINERARKMWEMQLWPEYIILGTYELPALQQTVALSAITVQAGFNTSANGYNGTFADISAIREGSNPLLVEDPGVINAVQPDLWAATTTPVKFVNRGQSGIYLLGSYTAAKTLSFFGKGGFVDIGDSETWIIDAENALIAGAMADMVRFHERDIGRADQQETIFNTEVAKAYHRRTVQSASTQKIIPLAPWTSYGYGQQTDVSKTGIGLSY